MSALHILLEIFGYTGTALVLLSMTMTSITKLRWLNMLGSLICAIYALLTGTYPVMFLNLGMILINSTQLIRAQKQGTTKKQEKEMPL